MRALYCGWISHSEPGQYTMSDNKYNTQYRSYFGHSHNLTLSLVISVIYQRGLFHKFWRDYFFLLHLGWFDVPGHLYKHFNTVMVRMSNLNNVISAQGWFIKQLNKRDKHIYLPHYPSHTETQPLVTWWPQPVCICQVCFSSLYIISKRYSSFIIAF